MSENERVDNHGLVGSDIIRKVKIECYRPKTLSTVSWVQEYLVGTLGHTIIGTRFAMPWWIVKFDVLDD